MKRKDKNVLLTFNAEVGVTLHIPLGLEPMEAIGSFCDAVDEGVREMFQERFKDNDPQVRIEWR